MHAEERGGNTERIVRTKVMEGMLSILLLCEPKLDMPSLMYPVWTTWEGRHNWRHIVFFIPPAQGHLGGCERERKLSRGVYIHVECGGW